jgi:hypothetical protein
MLQLHDLAKADAEYRQSAPAEDVTFPAGATWLVFSDQVLHAALKGKCMLEQTIYLDREVIADRTHSPVDVLERMLGRPMTRGADTRPHAFG